MERACGREGCVSQLLRSGDREYSVVGRKSFCDRIKVYRNSSYGECLISPRVVCFTLRRKKGSPCTNLEHSSGTYLITTFLLLYRRNPNNGEGSSNCAIAFRISTIPPFPRPDNSISSLEAYLRRNLRVVHVSICPSFAPRRHARRRSEAHHPPGSATAAS